MSVNAVVGGSATTNGSEMIVGDELSEGILSTTSGTIGFVSDGVAAGCCSTRVWTTGLETDVTGAAGRSNFIPISSTADNLLIYVSSGFIDSVS